MYYPIYLDLKGKKVVVIGGGKVAERKVLALVKAGAVVTVVAPKVTKALLELANKKGKGKISHIKRGYKGGDLEGFELCFTAINSQKTTEKVSKEAKKRNIWLNAADVPEYCDFILPSVVDRGDLKIATSTGGKSPQLARNLRKKLEVEIGVEYENLNNILGAVRSEILLKTPKSVIKLGGYRNLAGDKEFLDLVKSKDKKAIDNVLREKFGVDFTLKKLGVKF